MSWDPARQHGRRHRQVAAKVIALAQGRCQIRGSMCTGIATEADHIKPLAEGGRDDAAQMQAACHACHAAKTAAEAERARKRIIEKTKRPTPKHPGLKQ